MFATRILTLALVSAAAFVVRGQEPAPNQVPPTAAGPTPDIPRLAEPADPARAQAVEEFVRLREEFSRSTAAALTSEELAQWVKGLSTRVRRQRAEEDLWSTRERLRFLESTGRAGTEEAPRRAPGGPGPAGGTSVMIDGLPDRETIRRWLENQMAEETVELANTLPTRELERRSKRLKRLTSLARVAAGLRGLGGNSVEIHVDPGVMPAGAADSLGPAASALSPDESGLGRSTTEPPVLPDAATRAAAPPDAPASEPHDEKADGPRLTPPE